MVVLHFIKSDRQFAKGGINNGERFPYKYDRRHNINLTINHKFSERIDIGASWVFYTGGTSTIPEEKTAVIRPSDGTNNGFGGGYGYGDYFDSGITSPTIGEVFCMWSIVIITGYQPVTG